VIPTEESDEECNFWLFEDICVPLTGVVVNIEKLIDHVFPSIGVTWRIKQSSLARIRTLM
jgi:hypothetical protein